MDPHISKFAWKRKSNYMPSLNLSSILPVTLIFLFHSNTLPFLCKWNFFLHIPEPLNLVPNLPSRPSPHVPTLPNINSLTMHTNYTHTGRTLLGWGGSNRGEGKSTCFCASLGSFSVRGNKKLRGDLVDWVTWSVTPIANLITAHSFSLDSRSHCCGISSEREWPQT